MNFFYLNRLEKVLVILFSIIFFVTVGLIGKQFFYSVSESIPAVGGVYSEGMVGKMQYLNPVFSDFNPVDRDISAFIFSGLMKYDPETQDIEDDIATHSLDVSKKVYAFTIKQGAQWHDGKKVTADDIMFTFQDVIQNSKFKNSLLRENFRGVDIRRINDSTVTFTLDKPYKFFLTNLVVGLLPKHILSSIPVENLDFSEFNYLSPIGTGPYKVVSITNDGSVEKVALVSNEHFYGEKPKITGVNFYIFPSFSQLELSKKLLDGVQSISKENKNSFKSQSLFKVETYTLPQYVAAFFNTESEKLKDKKVRWALSLGTDKEKILEDIEEPKRIDTPLLELNGSNWLAQYNTEKAQGALNDSGWKLPWKQEIDAQKIAQKTGVSIEPTYITSPHEGKNYATTQAEDYFLEGTVPEGTKAVYVNDYKLNMFKPEKKVFAYRMSIKLGTIKEGENDFRVEVLDSNDKKVFLDSIKIFYTFDETKAKDQQDLFDRETLEKSKKENANVQAVEKTVQEIKNIKDPFRINNEGKVLELNLITSSNPKEYRLIAEELKKQWEVIGVKLHIEVLDIEKLQTRVDKRDYDILIFGQNLGYNLGSYPYWHSSQAQSGFNFSQLKDFEIDTLLEETRATHNEEKRQKKLQVISEKLMEEMPAIFFYSPEKYLAISPRIKGVSFINLRDTRDRFAHIQDWYVSEQRKVKDGVGVMSFVDWYLKEVSSR